MIDFTLTPEQQSLRAGARAFAQNVLSTAPSLYSHLPTQTERFKSTLPIYRTAVQSGLIKAQIPVPLGGTSTGLLDAALVVEEFHAVEPSTAITILGTGLGLTPLILAGSKVQHEEFLAPFLKEEGEPLASFAHSEPQGTANWLEVGGDGLQTTAYKDGDEWVVNGEKLWTTNSGGWDNHGAALTCLVCRLISPPTPSPSSTSPTPSSNPAENILILLLTRPLIAAQPSSAYKILSDPELGGHKSVNGPHTLFKNFRVPHANLLCPPDGSGAKTVETTFGTSAALVGAMSIGIMRHAFSVALAFAKTQTRGGTKKIIEYQAVSEKLMDMKMSIDAGRGMVWRAMRMLENEGVEWEEKLEAGVQAKIWGSERCVQEVVRGMGVVGMQSYKEEMGFVKMLQDAACLPLFDGGNVGVRRRQLEKIMQGEGYEGWAGLD